MAGGPSFALPSSATKKLLMPSGWKVPLAARSQKKFTKNWQRSWRKAMDNHQILLSFLGIARKAGALQIGSFLSFAAVKDKKAKMLICAQDAAESTKKE